MQWLKEKGTEEAYSNCYLSLTEKISIFDYRLCLVWIKIHFICRMCIKKTYTSSLLSFLMWVFVRAFVLSHHAYWWSDKKWEKLSNLVPAFIGLESPINSAKFKLQKLFRKSFTFNCSMKLESISLFVTKKKKHIHKKISIKNKK